MSRFTTRGWSTNLSRARRRVEVSLLAPAPPQARMAARGRRWAMICRAGGQDAQTSSDQRVMVSSLLAFNPIIRIRSPPQAPAGGEKVLPGAPAACSPNRHQFLTNSSLIPHQFLTNSSPFREAPEHCFLHANIDISNQGLPAVARNEQELPGMSRNCHDQQPTGI